MESLALYAKLHPCNLTYKQLEAKIIDNGHLGLWRSFVYNFLFYKDGRKRNIVQTGMPGSDLETVERYLKMIFNVFVYCGEDSTFMERMYMPDYET